jgi:hypothetical protein
LKGVRKLLPISDTATAAALREVTSQKSYANSKLLSIGPHYVEVALIEEQPYGKYICVFRSSETSPTILFTCREYREAALEHYQPFKHRECSNTKTDFIDPLRDILFYNGSHLSLRVLEDVFKLIPNITRLALSAFNLCGMLHTKPDFRRLGNFDELIALPPVSIAFREGPVVFED